VSLRDVTELVRLEESRRTLERAVAEAQRLESLGVLAAGVGHDFNNLLTVVLGNAAEALEELPPESTAAELVQQLMVAARRAGELTRKLMACAGGGQVEVRPIPLADMTRELADLLQVSLGPRRLLRVEVEGPEPRPLADPTQVRQVITNLVLNAAEAMADRPGTIVLRVRGACLDAAGLVDGLVPEAGPGDYAVLEVADDGPGMSEATRARIFEPFFTTKPTGRGLGLASVMGIVRAHGGAIQVESTEGCGTTFRILLPRQWAGAPVARA